ncbi:MAG TPA: nuclear transport factor 2 family protein [Planctomycetes bacterium]|nr:nuclear transport factor 2 family protein [Planctomycetota bacterium]HIN80379.1 nuclear transport factor 2 family protein [Planctomycetota bacterium]
MGIVRLGGETAAPDADHGFDAETFKEFISFDVGDGDPIYYHSVGKLYRQPGGEIIAGVEALVSNRLVKMEGNQAEAICRTLVIYRDPDTGEILQEDDGRHIIREYPYICARFELKDRLLVIHTEGLSGPHQNGHYGLAKVSNDKVFAQRSGGRTFFYWTLYGEVETPIGKVWFNEAYNGSTSPDVMVMNRYGTLPAFAGMGDGFMQTTAARIDSYEELPEQLREYVAKHAPSHCAPPADEAEIARLKEEYLGETPPEAPKSAAPEKLSKEQIAEVVGQYFSCLRSMEVDELLELFSEDAMSYDPVGTPPLLVRDKSTNYFRALSSIFEKMALTEDDIFVAGSEAAVRWTGVAKLRSKQEEITFEGVSVFTVNPEGLISGVRSYWDKKGLMSSL